VILEDHFSNVRTSQSSLLTFVSFSTGNVQLQTLEDERLSLLEMDQSGELDAEMREMVRGEQKDLVVKQLVLEAAITTMLLPSDPNDDRCVLQNSRTTYVLHCWCL
jgi:protein subunit release factor A